MLITMASDYEYVSAISSNEDTVGVNGFQGSFPTHIPEGLRRLEKAALEHLESGKSVSGPSTTRVECLITTG